MLELRKCSNLCLVHTATYMLYHGERVPHSFEYIQIHFLFFANHTY